MRKVLAAMVAILLFCAAAAAQDAPRVEVFGGYSIAHLGISNSNLSGVGLTAADLTGVTSLSTSNWLKSGMDGSVTYNFNRYVGFESDFRYYSGDVVTAKFPTAGVTATGTGNLRDFTFMFGPRVALRKSSKITPFAHVLFGGNDVKAKASAKAGGVSVTALSTSDTGFAMGLGGGVDVNASRMLGIRLIQVDYARTSAFGTSLNDVALAFGVNLRLGSVGGVRK
jgi:hypothetical protein